MLSDVLPLVFDLVGASIAFVALAPLREVAALVPKHRLRRAWQALTLVVVCGIFLLLGSVAAKLGKPLDAGDMVAGLLHMLGPSFVLAVACLSRSTARSVLRVDVLEKEAAADPLTELGNRRRFDERLADEVARARHAGRPLSLITLDVDHFKRINDDHGHASGDAALRAVAVEIAAGARHSDTACRVGGDEFALIVPGLPATGVERVAERLRRAVAEKGIALPEGGMARLTVSLGMATLNADESAEAFARRADRALYVAKREGRDQARQAA